MNSEITAQTVLFSEAGGSLDVVHDGEVMATIWVPPGRVSATDYLDFVPQGAELQVGRDLVALQPRSRSGIQPFGKGSHDSGANPDFKPTSASRVEREMRLMMSKMQAQSAHFEALQLALDKVERIPNAPAGEVKPTPDDKVIE